LPQIVLFMIGLYAPRIGPICAYRGVCQYRQGGKVPGRPWGTTAPDRAGKMIPIPEKSGGNISRPSKPANRFLQTAAH
jgi:hypothetical protein